MRKTFIALSLVVFLVYCWASVTFQNQVAVPGYRMVSVDIFGNGRTRGDWDKDPQIQFQRLMELEGAKYQLPAGTLAPEPPPVGDAGKAKEESVISSDQPLDSDAFTRFIAGVPVDQGLVMELRDTSDIYRLVTKNYLLRDPVMRPGDAPDQPPLYAHAAPIDKEMIDGLLANGTKVITVTGHGPPVSFDLGTSIMVAVIFLTLAAALKPLLWEPFQIMLDKRRQELDAGNEAARRNQEDEARLADLEKTGNNKLLLTLDDMRKRAQAEAERAADDIIYDAREREKGFKLAGLHSLGIAADEAKTRLDEEIPELAEHIANLLTPGVPRDPRGGKDDGENDHQK